MTKKTNQQEEPHVRKPGHGRLVMVRAFNVNDFNADPQLTNDMLTSLCIEKLGKAELGKMTKKAVSELKQDFIQRINVISEAGEYLEYDAAPSFLESIEWHEDDKNGNNV